MVKFWKKKAFHVKNRKRVIQNFFSNPFCNHKSISYPHLIINKCRGVRKMVQIYQEVKMSKKITQNFTFGHFFLEFWSFSRKMFVAYMKKYVFFIPNGFIFENQAKTKQTVKFWKKNIEKFVYFMVLGFFLFFFGGGWGVGGAFLQFFYNIGVMLGWFGQ